MDYNWLFSATAQCSAAIVAIIGGFIASRLLSLNSERRELGVKIVDINNEIDHSKERLGELKALLLRDDAEDFIKEKLDDLLRSAPLEQVYSTAESRKHSIDEYRSFWDNALQMTFAAKKYYDGSNEIALDFNDIAREQLSNMYDLEYYIWKKVHNVYRAQQHPFGYYTGDLLVDVNNTDLSEYRDIQKEYTKLEANINWLEKQKVNYGQRISALERPQGMASGIIVFIIFSLVGVIVPLLFMPYIEGQNAPHLKWIDIGLFVLGLSGVIWYLLSFLNSDSKRK